MEPRFLRCVPLFDRWCTYLLSMVQFFCLSYYSLLLRANSSAESNFPARCPRTKARQFRRVCFRMDSFVVPCCFPKGLLTNVQSALRHLARENNGVTDATNVLLQFHWTWCPFYRVRELIWKVGWAKFSFRRRQNWKTIGVWIEQLIIHWLASGI